MNNLSKPHAALLAVVWAGVAAVVAGCISTPLPTPTMAAPAAVALPPTEEAPPTEPEPMVTISDAANPRDYRRDAARHLYGQNAHRIFQGKMPPLLYAIGVLQVELDDQGRVTGVHWMRAPSHAPEVVAEIERTVRLAAPYPVPARMGRVTYTDTWLWHSSGFFQLDTLTEGQL